jgi:hypothetical protein
MHLSQELRIFSAHLGMRPRDEISQKFFSAVDPVGDDEHEVRDPGSDS